MYKVIVLTQQGKIYRIHNNLNYEEAERLFYKYTALGFRPQLHTYGFYNW